MARKRYNKDRDHRFDDWRRDNVRKGGITLRLALYSSDLDSIEYCYRNNEPHIAALVEKKHEFSTWKRKWRSSQQAQFALAQRADVPFYVAEHNTLRSKWRVYHIKTIDRPPCDDDVVMDGNLADYVEWLYVIRDRKMPEIFKEIINRVLGISPDGESIEQTNDDKKDAA